MQIFLQRQGALVCFCLLSVFFVVRGSNYEDHRTVEVVGLGECSDCSHNNIKNSHAFSGLRVAVNCMSPNGHFRTRGVGALDEYGNFKVSLPQDMVEDGELKEDCYAQLHSASASAEPCPSHGNSKIVTKSLSDHTHTLGPAAGKLTFSSAMCTSAFFWHFFKHPQFPFPPKDDQPKDPLPPPVPVHNEPVPPVYKKPPTPTYKKPPTSTPSPVVKKPSPPKENTPSPTPIYKPLPPTTPISEPSPPTPPLFKFFPPLPFKKNPCPPLIPKMEPPKYFQHPWFGNWPPSHS